MAPPSDGSRQVRFDLENGHVAEPRSARNRAPRGSSSQDHEAGMALDRSRSDFASESRQGDRNRPSYVNIHSNGYHHTQYAHHVSSPKLRDEDDEDDDRRTESFMPVSSPNSHSSNSHNRYSSRSPMADDEQPMSRPNRPTPVQRTPSNTYAPQRGRPPTQPPANVYGDHHRPNARRREFTRRDPLRIWRQEKFGYDYRNNDSDSDGETATTDDVVDSEAVMFYIDDNQEPTEEDFRDPDSAERLHWQRMLSTALSGDVIGQEKKRLTPGGMDQEQLAEDELFIMLRAARFRRHISVQRKILTDARTNLGRQIDDIMNFTVKGEEEADGKGPYEQVKDAVKLIEKSYSTIMAWYNTTEMLNTELKILRRWVGNKNLSIEKSEDGVAKEASSFIHRLLNNGSLGSLYPDGKSSTKKKSQYRLRYQGNENPEHSQSESELPESAPITQPTTDGGVSLGKGGGMLINLFSVVDKAKTTLISMADAFEARHLPLPIEELATIINFPLRLIQTMLQEQVANAKTANIKSAAQTNTLILDQMIAQFKTLLGMSVDLNKKYLEIIKPERNWDIPDSLDESYASDVFNALRFYFKMLNWKLSNNKNTFKETEVLSNEWDFANSIGGHFKGWEIELAEHFSHVTHKTLTRLATTFEREMREKKDETTAAMSKRIKACLDSVRVRQRMLQRFSRRLNDNYENACDYSMSLEPTTIQEMVDNLAATHHVRLATHFDEQGFMLICSPSLARARWKLENHVQAMMAMTSNSQILPDGETHYVAIIKAEDRPIWMEDTINLELSDQVLDLQVGHVRLLAASTDERYEEANDAFLDAVEVKLDVVMERRSNLTKVNQKLTELRRVAYKVSNTVMDSVETIRAETRNKNCEELVQTCFMSATEFGQRALQYMDENRRQMNNIKLSKLALDWVSFINEDCMGTDKRTFRWAMQALDFVSAMTRGRQILGLTEPDWARLRRSVSGCMTMLVLHLDVMGARSSIQAKAEAKRKLEVYEQQTKMAGSRLMDDDEAAQIVSMTRQTKIQEREKKWAINDAERMGFGRVLEDTNDLDRSLMDMSSATNNGTLRWQMGQFVGSGAFGSVYVGVNLSRGQLMAVKEIRLQDPKSVLKIKDLIIHEVNLLKALDHPNVVACYGVEVRRDRVFIFMEFCSGGSLAGLLEHGPIDDEMTLQELTLAMLEGLRYLHSRDIVHRDIKPANILLDHAGVVKFVDFGAAKVIVRHNHTTTMEINPSNASSNPAVSTIRPGTTGTPMYMAPEVVRGEQIDNPKASDIWSLGCVILELVTGQRPWPAADNEFAIMFNIGNGMVPDMPSEGRLSDLGRDFLSCCLQVEPTKRATAEALLQHPWIVQAIASAKDMEVETPSDSSQSGTPSGNRIPVDGLFPSDQ